MHVLIPTSIDGYPSYRLCSIFESEIISLSKPKKEREFDTQIGFKYPTLETINTLVAMAPHIIMKRADV